MRLCIAGVPKAGKTTLADRLGVPQIAPLALVAGDEVLSRGRLLVGARARHTDDLIRTLAWSDASAQVATWLDAQGPWIIEGVAVPRALRKWLALHPRGKPCDRVVWLGRALIPLLDGQQRMAKGCETVWCEVRPLLVARGVHITES